MADITDAELDAFVSEGSSNAGELRASSARYDSKSKRIVVELTNGCTFAFPPSLAQGLESATDAELAEIEVLGAGYGLHWERLDVDFTVQGLISGVFGTASWMARRAGKATSAAKAAAARANRAKGGRPPKSARR
ncbi:DUF2442 domain-containing protein [Aquibium oceanicum]|uniref:DUF2442 domain-containing protein n=1 Tax=Aquibium oceanicum TaxID=1670800 RepID=A0A1L3STT1_9HYPH|nr:DUF2442 domain-containing protein [Aquibium oceanicum]APH72816.1 hypothetical protein BSQ44_16670 [Aquibium oceanicum]